MKIKMTKLPGFLSNDGRPTIVETRSFKGENTLLQFANAMAAYEKDGYTNLYLYEIYTDVLQEFDMRECIENASKIDVAEGEEVLYVRCAITKE